MTKQFKQVLDPACGGRKFYFDKNNPIVLFGDIRDESYVQCDYRTLNVHPDQNLDFRSLPFGDSSFYLVIFDPPHLYNLGKTSYMAQSSTRKLGRKICKRALENAGEFLSLTAL